MGQLGARAMAAAEGLAKVAASRDAVREVCGEAVEAREVHVRKSRRTVGIGDPAPLLMRVSKRKATLDPSGPVRA